MFAVGAAWPDGSAPGIHLAWTGPDLVRVCQKGKGFDVERRAFLSSLVVLERQSIDNAAPQRRFDALRRLGEIDRPMTVLGPFACAAKPPFRERVLDDPRLAQESLAPRVYPRGKPAAEPSPLFGSNELTGAEIESAARATLGSGGLKALFGEPGVERFTQTLIRPADTVEMTLRARCAFAAGLRRGKVLSTAVLPEGSLGEKRTLRLAGLSMDTVVLYVPADPALDDLFTVVGRYDPLEGPWVPIAKGVTLPIREADPTLLSPDDEIKKVLSRLWPGEPTPDATQLGLMLDALRALFSPEWLGRAADRVLLVRQRPDDPPMEISLEAQLTALLLHPKWRRVIGFGLVDAAPGTGAFQYRITGHFNAAELNETRFDVHAIPSGTEIPHVARIGSLKLSFSRPPRVVLAPPLSVSGQIEVTRRGLKLVPGAPGARWTWIDDIFTGDLSLVLTFARPVKAVDLELGVGHSLSYKEGVREWPPLPKPRLAMPPGKALGAGASIERVSLTFAKAIHELQIFGPGILYAVVLPGTGTGDPVTFTPPIEYPGTAPPPDPPALFFAKNLQRPEQASDEKIDESTALPPRHDIGFELTWLPPVTGPFGDPTATGIWPDDLPGAPPLVASAYRIEHRELKDDGTPAGGWTPLAPDDNLTFGSRETASARESLFLGADLAELYKMAPHASPARDKTAGFTLHLLDVFDRAKGDGTFEQRLPKLGTSHEYRILCVDFIGGSRDVTLDGSWTKSRPVQLQKRFPPPQPVGPVAAVAPAPGEIAPPGVRAKVIVDGPALSPSDRAHLTDGSGKKHDNAVVLQCAWRNVVYDDDGNRANGGERERDPYATELRVYSMSRPPTEVSGKITAVKKFADRFELTFEQTAGEAWLQKNECANQWLPSAGYEFEILENGEVTADGQAVSLVVARSAIDPALEPAVEAVLFGRRLTRHHLRTYYWDRREAVLPLHADPDEANYQITLYDLFDLGAEKPKQTLWVGVTAADAEPYIPDAVTRARNASLLVRPGNESVVAAVSVSATYAGRPELDVPPPLRDLPEVVANEPVGEQTPATVPLSDWLGTALRPGERIHVERCDTDKLAALLSVEGSGAGRTLKLLHEGAQHTIALGELGPDDQKAILDAFSAGTANKLAAKYHLWLTYRHPQPDTLFAPLPAASDIPYGTFVDYLPAKPGRHLYRARRVDAAGRVSEGAAYAPGAVRVPRLTPPPSPEKEGLVAKLATSGALSTTLTVSFPNDDDISHVVLFQRKQLHDPAAEEGKALPSGAAELLRVPNRRDLYEQGKAIRLRSPDNLVIEPVFVKAIAGNPDVSVDAEGRRLTVNLRAEHDQDEDGGAFVQSYCCTLSKDGIPSAPAGPFGVFLPKKEQTWRSLR